MLLSQLLLILLTVIIRLTQLQAAAMQPLFQELRYHHIVLLCRVCRCNMRLDSGRLSRFYNRYIWQTTCQTMPYPASTLCSVLLFWCSVVPQLVSRNHSVVRLTKIEYMQESRHSL